MKVDVISCILDLLQSNQKVVLPGLGQWQTNNHPAEIKTDRIYPPYKSILFNEKADGSESLAQCIRERYKISKKGADQVVQRFSKLIINRLVNYKEVYIPKLGTLKSGSGKTLNFEEEQPNLLNMAKNYLPSFGLIPVEPIEIQNTIPVKVTPNPIMASTNKINQNNTSSSNPAYYEDEKGCLAQFFWPLFWLLLLAIVCIYGLKKCASLSQSVSGDKAGLVNDNTYSESNDGNSGDQAGNANETNSLETFDASKEYLLSEINDIPDAIFEQGCIIIVGSYGKSKNVIRMKSQLRSQGKDVYTQVLPNGLTRVGFNLDCDRVAVKELIENARNNINAQAWYLKPKIKVAYR